MATFITSKAVGQFLSSTYVQTTSGYWKAYHNGTYSSIYPSGAKRNLPITNANGEFTLVACDADGEITGNITTIGSNSNQIISFDGTDLTSLTELVLSNNQLTSFDGTDLTSLTSLQLQGNPIATFNGGDMSSLISLNLNGINASLTTFNGGNMTNLTSLIINSTSNLTTFNGGNMTSLTDLNLAGALVLTTFNGGNMTSLTSLNFPGFYINTLTSFDGSGLSGLTDLNLSDNQLTSFDGTGLDVLQYLYIENNPFTNPTSTNNSLLAKLAANELANDWDSGEFSTTGGRTSAGTTDYDYLIANGWTVSGADLPTPPPTGNGKLRIKGVNSGGGTTTTTTTAPPLWDGGTIYNIGAVVTFEGQTWNCIQYAPAGYGPFGGHIDVYWTL